MAWQAKLAAAVTAAPGFESLEYIPMITSQLDWRILLQFTEQQHLTGWHESEAHRALRSEVRSLAAEGAPDVPTEEEAADFHGRGSITEVIATNVKPGHEQSYRTWSARIQQAQSAYPGYRGTYIQAPTEQQRHWTTLVRFATAPQLDSWLVSAERQKLLSEGDASIQSWKSQRLPSAFAGWFAADSADAPPSWKQAMLVLLALFPVVMAEVRYLSPQLHDLNPALATFLGNAISIAILTWLIMPVLIRLMDWWLNPAPENARWAGPAGILLIVGLYLVEVGLLWQLLRP
jgi:antibiotic biosynthesis monooxygenase (ABM) superfamily enzyme